jgi:tetratricopeptide (TPR) repeat protein
MYQRRINNPVFSTGVNVEKEQEKMRKQTDLGERPEPVSGEALPDFNELVLHFLRQSGASVEQFGQLYGQAIKDRPYTKSRLYQMIRDKSFPTDPERRWVIAKLLQIPPFLLGVKVLDDLLPEVYAANTPQEPQSIASLDMAQKHLDLKEYRQALEGYWDLNLTHTAMTVLQEMNQRIFSLEQAFLYESYDQRQRLQFVRLLCKYHMVLGNMARDQEWYETAIAHFNQAYVLARNEHLSTVQAAALKGRGDVFLDRGGVYTNMLDANLSRHYLSLAVDDFGIAREIIDYRDSGSGDKGFIQLSFGEALAHAATNPHEFHQALKEIDKAETFIGKGLPGVDNSFVKLDEERYHLNRASAYLGASVKMARYPREARRELWNASAAQVSSKAKRRQALSTALFAKSYLIEGEYAEALEKAREALVQARAIHSHINLARVTAICRGLQASGYGKNHLEISSLEIEVAKAKHPGLFQ